MMGIYIKDIEMPSIGTYEASIDITNINDKTVISLFVRGEGGLVCCGVYEVVLVPSHGDLIDYDFCMQNYELLHDDDGNPVYAVRMREINSAPTVIPAEEGEHGSRLKGVTHWMPLPKRPVEGI